MSFGESNLQEAMAFTQQAGLHYLYHEGPFETWGHFKLNSKEFPNNWSSLKACVEKAKAQNINWVFIRFQILLLPMILM